MNVCMTAEQKKNKEKAERFLLYLYQKYYPLIAEEIASREKNTITTEKDEVSTQVFSNCP